jgi:hypothetical protein
MHDEKLPIQFLLRKELNEDDNLWLKGLGEKQDGSTIERIFDKVKLMGKQRIGEYIEAFIEANTSEIKEAAKMSTNLAKTMEEIGFIEKSKVDELLAESVKEKDTELAKKMLRDGTSPQLIAKWLEMPLNDVVNLQASIKSDNVN